MSESLNSSSIGMTFHLLLLIYSLSNLDCLCLQVLVEQYSPNTKHVQLLHFLLGLSILVICYYCIPSSFTSFVFCFLFTDKHMHTISPQNVIATISFLVSNYVLADFFLSLIVLYSLMTAFQILQNIYSLFIFLRLFFRVFKHSWVTIQIKHIAAFSETTTMYILNDSYINNYFLLIWLS